MMKNMFKLFALVVAMVSVSGVAMADGGTDRYSSIDNLVEITQTNDPYLGGYNDLDVYQIGHSNEFVGAKVMRHSRVRGWLMRTDHAVQHTTYGNNIAYVGQYGSYNLAGLHQTAYTGNYAAFYQYGDYNTALVFQDSYASYNDADIYQDGYDVAKVHQTGYRANDAHVVQSWSYSAKK